MKKSHTGPRGKDDFHFRTVVEIGPRLSVFSFSLENGGREIHAEEFEKEHSFYRRIQAERVFGVY